MKKHMRLCVSQISKCDNAFCGAGARLIQDSSPLTLTKRRISIHTGGQGSGEAGDKKGARSQ